MERICGIARLTEARPTIEGAGVHLHRAFGYGDIPAFDPFLMLDDFRAGDDPGEYLAGFPWHPHRGIETVTYMLEGRVEHGDSMGNAGRVNAGDVQWMTAGSGIIHQEMPKPVMGRMGGFQLWVNLPRLQKMMDPRYQEIPSRDIPVVHHGPGVTIRVIAGIADGIRGPVRGIVTDPVFLDVTLENESNWTLGVSGGDTAAAYIIGGKGSFSPEQGDTFGNRNMVLFDEGNQVHAHAAGDIFRFLLLSGKPVKEPVAWRGPIVMNTEDELKQAFREYREGNFVKDRA
jgi:quercetin 2,3-dioxygenase